MREKDKIDDLDDDLSDPYDILAKMGVFSDDCFTSADRKALDVGDNKNTKQNSLPKNNPPFLPHQALEIQQLNPPTKKIHIIDDFNPYNVVTTYSPHHHPISTFSDDYKQYLLKNLTNSGAAYKNGNDLHFFPTYEMFETQTIWYGLTTTKIFFDTNKNPQSIISMVYGKEMIAPHTLHLEAIIQPEKLKELIIKNPVPGQPIKIQEKVFEPTTNLYPYQGDLTMEGLKTSKDKYLKPISLKGEKTLEIIWNNENIDKSYKHHLEVVSINCNPRKPLVDDEGLSTNKVLPEYVVCKITLENKYGDLFDYQGLLGPDDMAHLLHAKENVLPKEFQCDFFTITTDEPPIPPKIIYDNELVIETNHTENN
jgi:hypothetical protein